MPIQNEISPAKKETNKLTRSTICFTVLKKIAFGYDTLPKLVNELKITKPSIFEAVSILKSKSIVLSKPHPNGDGRSTIFSINADGLTKLYETWTLNSWNESEGTYSLIKNEREIKKWAKEIPLSFGLIENEGDTVGSGFILLQHPAITTLENFFVAYDVLRIFNMELF